MSSISWPESLAESTHYFRELLKIDTTNPPGNERTAAEYMAGILRDNGVESTILESAPLRANLIARLKGDGSLPPLLLMGHLDVVSAEPDKWSHPPFSAHLDEDGYIYARGSLDMKPTVCAEMMALLLVKRACHDQGRLPKRDIILMANADEETGGEYGAGWIAEHHPDLIQDAEFALNEGGGGGMELNGVRYISIQAGEKATSRFYLRARGKPGHGAVPQQDSSIIHLTAAVHKLGTSYLPVHITPTTRHFLQILRASQPEPVATLLQDLLDTEDADRILPQLPFPDSTRRGFQAMLRNTANPTILRAGQQLNVIPDVAEAGIDGRLLPGQSQDDFAREVRACLGELAEGLEIEWHAHFGPALEVDFQGSLTDVIREVMAEAAPGMPLLPTLVVGGTDAKTIAPLGIKVIGFSPHQPDDDDPRGRGHGHDERINVKNYHYVVRNTYEIVERFVNRG